MELSNPQQIVPSISNQIVNDKVTSLVERAQNANATKSGKDLKSTAQEFESLLLYKMIEAMRKTVPKSGLLNSFSMDMYQSMMDQEMANELAKKGTFGLSQMLYKELTKIQNKLDEQTAKGHNGEKPKTSINTELNGEI